MVWIVAGILLLGAIFALVDRLTDAPIQRRRVNIGTDRYRASMDWVRATDQSIFDIRVGDGRISDPTSKKLPINPPGDDDSKSAI
jgi:hypothetical protein